MKRILTPLARRALWYALTGRMRRTAPSGRRLSDVIWSAELSGDSLDTLREIARDEYACARVERAGTAWKVVFGDSGFYPDLHCQAKVLCALTGADPGDCLGAAEFEDEETARAVALALHVAALRAYWGPDAAPDAQRRRPAVRWYVWRTNVSTFRARVTVAACYAAMPRAAQARYQHGILWKRAWDTTWRACKSGALWREIREAIRQSPVAPPVDESLDAALHERGVLPPGGGR